MYFVRTFNLAKDELVVRFEKSLKMCVVKSWTGFGEPGADKVYLAVVCDDKSAMHGIYQCVGYLVNNTGDNEKVRLLFFARLRFEFAVHRYL